MDSTKTNELFDPDPLSMCMIPEWVGMDFGKPVPYHKSGISRGMMPMGFSLIINMNYFIMISPRMDFYGHKNSYRHLHRIRRRPQQRIILVAQPYLGQEERIFTWENGKAHFW